jgi:SNF2 family DNA or RNA helicase
VTYEYQQDGIDFLRSRTRAILGDDPGLGKSRQALLAAEGRTLVVAPAMVLDTDTWRNEWQRWRPDLDCTFVSYTSLCAREGARVLPRPRAEYAGEWGTVIFDEAHYLKNRKTNWTLAAKKIKTERMYLLTGTPIPNWAHEAYMLLLLTNPGDSRFTSYWRWIGEWFEVDNVVVNRAGRTAQKIGSLRPGVDWQQFQQQNLGDVFLRRLRGDVLADLPPLTETHIVVPMQPEQRRVYNSLRDDFIAWLDSGVEVVAWSKPAQVVQMAKCATSTATLADDVESPSSGKMALLVELLSEPSEPALVVCHFRASAAESCRVLRDAGRVPFWLRAEASQQERARVVAAFQAGDIDVLVSTIELIKEGLTLTRADRVVFVEHSYRPSSNEQTLRRVHRIGQSRPVSAVHLWSEDSIDLGMRALLSEKTDQQVRALPVAALRPLV